MSSHENLIIDKNYDVVERQCSQIETLLSLDDTTPLINIFLNKEEELIALMEGSFELEDSILFPAIIEAQKDRVVTESILELQKEHAKIDQALTTIFSLIRELSPTDDALSKVIPILTKNIILTVRTHIKDEKALFESLHI